MRGLTNAEVSALELLGRGMDSARIRKDCYRCVTINPSEIGVSKVRGLNSTTRSARSAASQVSSYGITARLLREGAQIVWNRRLAIRHDTR